MPHVVLIPTDLTRAVEVHDIPSDNFDRLNHLAFKDDEWDFTFLSFSRSGFQLGLDDLGAIRPNRQPRNLRAMDLATRHGYTPGYPLLGPALLLGVDQHSGEWVDVPTDVVVEIAQIAQDTIEAMLT